MKSETIERRRQAHHSALEVIAQTVGCQKLGLKLWRELNRLERKVYSVCEAYSSDSNCGLEKWEACKDSARLELKRIFGGAIPEGVYINGDPRGHMLKLDCDVVTVPGGMERDWGGNGILAATIEEEN